MPQIAVHDRGAHHLLRDAAQGRRLGDGQRETMLDGSL